MTKLSSKTHLFVIISVVIVAIGMAVGTVCHFLAGGFFNFGGEYSDYKSIVITCSVAEDADGSKVKEITQNALSGIGYYEYSFSDEGSVSNEFIYKFVSSTSTDSLRQATESINTALSDSGLIDSVATLHEGVTTVGGAKVAIYASIALASGIAFQAIYFGLRYKWGMALTALLSQVHNLAIYAALLALTRVPIGLECVAFAAVIFIVTAITSGVYFDKIKKALKEEANAKVSIKELSDTAAHESYKTGAFICSAVAVVCVIAAIFAIIANPAISSLVPYAAALISVLACWYGYSIFTPALYGGISKLDKKA
ncbi:MAG: hypothetical protein ACI4MH_02575 [Candidatus Coproplasma sp.]